MYLRYRQYLLSPRVIAGIVRKLRIRLEKMMKFKRITTWNSGIIKTTRMTTSISSDARRNQTSILIRGQENHISP